MSLLLENIGHFLLMLLLLFFSAFLSGSETAYFNLSRRQMEQLRHSRHNLSHLAAQLAAEPHKLLSALLFGNMAANVSYFAVSSLLVLRIERQSGVTAAAVTAVAAFICLLLFGEIVPKSFSYAQSKTVSIFAAMGIYLLVKGLKPVLYLFQFLIITPALRLLIGGVRHPQVISADEFRSLMERIRSGGHITAAEHRMAGEIVGLNLLKIRHCLRPRVDMPACDVTDSPKAIINLMQQHNIIKIPVYYEHIDNIIGFVYLRDLLTRPEAKVSQVVHRAHYVPEQKTIESLLEYFRQSGTDTAIVVDEYGQIAGTISLEDIAGQIFGPVEGREREEMIEQIGTLKYRLGGELALHEWARSFGIDFLEAKFATIGGLVSWLLGRIPCPGDTAKLRNLKFTVENVKNNRVQTVILELEQQSKSNEKQ